MRLETISSNSNQILNIMRDLIENGEAERLKENPSGWQYGGKEFNRALESLRQEMQRELDSQGFHVIGCTVRHFVRGANILNYLYPAKRILMIPMNGISTLSTGGELPPDKYCFIEDRPTLSGENIDVVFVGFEVKNENK